MEKTRTGGDPRSGIELTLDFSIFCPLPPRDRRLSHAKSGARRDEHMATLSVSSAATPVASLLASDIHCNLEALGVLDIAGADAGTFLQGQLSNDVRRVSTTAWQYTTYNSPKGRVLATLLLWADEGGYRVLLPSELADAIRKRLAMYVLRSRVTITDGSATYARIGLAGPTAHAIVREIAGDAPAPHQVLRGGALCILGLAPDRFIVIAPEGDGAGLRARLGQHAQAAGCDAWQWLAVRAGVPVITPATQDLFVAQTANLDALSGISFDKGCYTGQEIIARTQYLGRLKERMYVWHSDAQAVAPGTRLYSAVFGEQACGTVVNAAPAPNGGIDLLAVVQTAAAEANDVRLGGPEGPFLARLPLPYVLPEPSAPARPKL